MSEVARRRFLQGASALGVAGVLSSGRASASPRYHWLSGDHHTHTQYSYDGMYTIEQQIRGMQYMVLSKRYQNKLFTEAGYSDPKSDNPLSQMNKALVEIALNLYGGPS